MEIRQRLADRVKAFRKDKGWSQEELTDPASLHRTFVSQIERATEGSTIDSVHKIAKPLGVRYRQLLDE